MRELATNCAVGFFGGILLYHLIRVMWNAVRREINDINKTWRKTNDFQ